MLRRLALQIGTLGLVIATLAILFPINNRFTRLLVILGLAAAILGFLAFVWRNPTARLATFFTLGAGMAFLLWPSVSPPNFELLQSIYIIRLQSYNNTTYVWGGENKFGMDCSGLIRRGMIDALAATGVQTFNPHALRLAASLWWNDTTARTLGEGRNTVVIREPPEILPPAGILQPGDLAVSADGIHILAYLGDGRWIDADPTAGLVRILPSPKNPWLADPVRIVRWKWLAKPTPHQTHR